MYMLIAVAAGAGLAFQAVINTRLRVALGHPLSAAIVQGVVGLGLLAVLALVARPPMPLANAWRLPWWIWTGGLLGTAYVLAVILTTGPLGAALMMATVIVGQTTAALVIDHYGLMGVETHPLSLARVTGVVLLVAGVLLIRR